MGGLTTTFYAKCFSKGFTLLLGLSAVECLSRRPPRQHCLTKSSIAATPLNRRCVLLGTAAILQSSKPAGAMVVDQKVVTQRLSTVPVFIVSTSDGDTPYFTDTEYATKEAVATFFVEKEDAQPTLEKVRKSSDKEAVITSVPLSSAWEFVQASSDPKSRAENGGIFKLAASRKQIVHANGNSGRDLELEKKALVPLFFDRRVTVTSEGAFPLFFKLEDLQKIYAKGVKGLPAEDLEMVKKVNVEVTTLDRAIANMLDGSLDNAADVLFLSSESFN